MTARTAERTQFLSGLLNCAIEGGITEWAEIHSYRWQGLENTTGSVATIREVVENWSETTPIPGQLVACYEIEHEIDVDTVARGIRMIASGRVRYVNPGYPADRTRAGRIHARLYRQNSSNGMNCELGDYDSVDADAIVQAGIFEELRYG